MAVDPRNFLINTDYEMDKIIYFKEQYVTPNQYGRATIAHGLGITPLITGVWSTTSDFAVPHPFSPPRSYYSSAADENKWITDTVECYADSTNIYLDLYSGSVDAFPPTTYPFYVRLMGFEPSNSNADLPSTSDNAGKFIINTDYNYLKLHSTGVEAFPGSSPEVITITHNLGYRPQALFWFELTSGGTTETHQMDGYATAVSGLITSAQEGIESYTDRFVIYKPQYQYGSDFKLHYRIYYDQAV